MGYTKKQKRQMLNILVETGFKKFESYTRFREIYPTFARQTLDSWIKKDKEFKAAYDLEMEKQVEEAEEHHRYLRLWIGIVTGKQVFAEQTLGIFHENG